VDDNGIRGANDLIDDIGFLFAGNDIINISDEALCWEK
jgi:hypothetical protein